MMLLHFLRWLKANIDLEFVVVLREGGNLGSAFSKLAPTWQYSGCRVGRLSDTWMKIIRRIGWRGIRGREDQQGSLLERLAQLNFDLVYSNTITNGAVLDWLEPLGVPVLTHVHEMSHWIEACGPENLEAVKKHSVAYIAASHAVKRELDAKWGIPASKITVVHEFIPTNIPVPDSKRNAEIRRQLDIPLDAFLVVGSGVETWRKGKDLFVDLANELNRSLTAQDIRLVWVGAWEHMEHERQFRERLHSEGLERQVLFIGQVTNPLDYFAAADVFAMTSREDPYPLVCLEAALMGLPVLCFAGAGGVPEFVEDDAGMVFEYLNLPEMAQGIIELIENPETRRRLGRSATEKVRRRHDVNIGGQQLWLEICSCLESNPGRSDG